MNARTIRRAQERKARKIQNKADKQSLAETNLIPNPATPLDNEPVRKCATGPRTAAGKSISSRNAITTALTGRTVLLSTDDVVVYESRIAALVEEFQPGTGREEALIIAIADARWRLERIPRLDMAIFAKGREEFSTLFADKEPAQQAAFIEMHTFFVYEKQLRNLQIQEGRLRRQCLKDIADLRQLQEQRLSKEQEEATEQDIPQPESEPQLAVSAFREFDFSNDIEAYLNGAGLSNFAGKIPQIATDHLASQR